MRFNLPSPAIQIGACLLVCASKIHAHTWVEELRLIASNGSYVGSPGYPRGFIPRPKDLSYLLPPNGGPSGNAFSHSDLMCLPLQQLGVQSPGFPTLKAAPQDHIALRYEENGHVSLPTTTAGRPLNGGTVFVYGTTQALNTDTYLGIHRVWNTDGTGGDKRGRLLATQTYDDGRCFQKNTGSISQARISKMAWDGAGDLLCQNDVQIPADIPTTGLYTLYWVWEWPILYTNGAVQSNQSYTTCMDIQLTSKPVAAAGSWAVNNIVGTPAQSVAIEARYSTALMVNPTALPLVDPANLGATAPPGVPAPTAGAKSPAASTISSASQGASTSSSAASSKATASSVAAEGFITVTVTQTEYITDLGPTSTTSSQSMTVTLSTLTTTAHTTVHVSESSLSATAPTSSVSSVQVVTFPKSSTIPSTSVKPSATASPSTTATLAQGTSVPIPSAFLGTDGVIIAGSHSSTASIVLATSAAMPPVSTAILSTHTAPYANSTASTTLIMAGKASNPSSRIFKPTGSVSGACSMATPYDKRRRRRAARV